MDIDRTLQFVHLQLDEIDQWFALNLEVTQENVFSYYVLLGRLAAYNELLEELESSFRTDQYMTPELRNEIHSKLNDGQMADILHFRTACANKSEEDCLKLLYEWTKTEKLSFREFKWASIYLQHE